MAGKYTRETWQDWTIERLTKNEWSPYKVQKKLEENGLSEDDARDVVNYCRKIIEEERKSVIKNAIKNMVVGALFCIGGIAVTMASYSAVPNGGKYILWYGAIIGGAVDFIIGLYNLLKIII